MEIRVAGVQMPVVKEIGENHKTILRAVDFALDSRADVLLTPEGSLSGYTHDFDQRHTEKALADIRTAAAQGGLALALGTCFTEHDGKCYNQIRFYAGDGTYLGFHSKTLRCGTLADPPRGEIEHYAATGLKTFKAKGIVVGGLICNDLWANPACTPMPDIHLSQQLAGMGAKIIFHAVNGGRDSTEFSTATTRKFHESNLLIRAKAGGLFIVTVDNCFPLDMNCSSPGGVVSPKGEWQVQVPMKGEQHFTCAITV